MRIALLFVVLFIPALALAQHDEPENFPWSDRLFFPLRDVNTAEYEPDFAWQRLSERERQTKSGIDFWYGSLSERHLGVERRLQLNVPLLGEGLRFRWQHEEVAVEEIRAGSEKIELQFRLGGAVALALFGNGVLEKSQAGFGAGLLIAPGDRTSYVELGIRNDAVVHDARTPYDAKDRQPPLRILGEGNLETGAFRFYGFADWALESRRVYETPRGSGGIRDRRRFTRRTELKVEYALSPHAEIGARHRFSGQGDERRHFAGYDHAEIEQTDYDFERTHHRADVFGEHRFADRWRARAIAGYWVQDDLADFAITSDYTYRRTQFLYGARVHRQLGEGHEVGLGYWGDIMTAVREPFGPPAFRRRGERHEGYYVDKFDVVYGYRFNETARLEFLVSQEVTRGEFGGGCGKAVILF